ncbi:natural resistance-associated macrophage protein [Sulfobacillus acidophilus TPY]|nr:natural resistance-associated macrophage protein [Sulfobacillus acidophilus TPY]
MVPDSVEHQKRARDRYQVYDARRRHRRFRLLWLLIGPGVLVMLGENDAPSMVSYAATGSQFGPKFFLGFILLTFAMAYIVQEITVRIGVSSQSGHAELIYRRFGRFWGHLAMIDLLVTNFLTLIAEFVGIVTGAAYFHLPPTIAAAFGVMGVSVAVLVRRYRTWEVIILALALLNLVFVPIALTDHPPWGTMAQSLITWRPYGGWNASTLLLVVSDIGATVTPWMLFFQQSAVSDKGLGTVDIPYGRADTMIGAGLAALAALACVVATYPLFVHPMNPVIYRQAGFALALKPYVGRWMASLFALGIFESGLVAATTISLSSAYAFGEILGKSHSLNRPWHEAPGFYLVLVGEALLAGIIVVIPGFPATMVVLLVNVLAVLTMPPALGFLLLLANDSEVMGPHRNSRFFNVLGFTVAGLIFSSGVLFAVSVLFPQLFSP